MLTYLICDTALSRCNAYSDDLAGHRVRFKRLAPKGCGLGSAPACWGSPRRHGLHLHQGHGGSVKPLDANGRPACSCASARA